ncbi:Prolyl-tRNA synthetase [Roseomonas mucosa]|uniref:Proline--tRNA ligase n=1 Tax=Roseomonas mucosa TaxID=207340 RepID=A0A4Y1MZQ0_9PROT|nr:MULTISPECIES: proline--tRNA ligase [Roseomonas]MDT8263220.1 proline--tRNA ligase [Roseomonas sp. DSM 102946]ATR20068.1 proline--tRNA ligase [Roseomonas sp. FDAARGOS_362]AWV23482.1 Prolyl-tRNA synthetase [Roseomonas mucosa]MDT8277035.1 proline--tRNA ligase [Roseomonas mucosa]USQ71882.1 proline--tRNA ligase [Roseomonas mucosa]
MRLSRAFLPTLKETPAEAQIASHRLMLRAGLIRQTTAGIYAWLPLGLRVLRNIGQIVREEQDRAGSQEILMPTIQAAELWKESGRYEDYGKEMLRIRDRHDREMLYGPTNEEVITDIFKGFARSYRDLPRNLYQIQWKFRDEVRPRFGVMRGREFLMKDGYSFDISPEAARKSYHRMFVSYLRTFARMGLKAIPMRADTGPIGGNLSHEFIILAETGESQVFLHRDLLAYDPLAEAPDYDGDLTPHVDFWTSRYAATDEMHDEAAWNAVAAEEQVSARGIEVGHIFYFGTKYSAAMGFQVTGPEGNPVHPEMGSYGIGVSRLVAAAIEANHDENGIKWPDAIAPYKLAILNLKSGDAVCDAVCERIYAAFPEDAVYDDRPERAGVKFADADLMGFPWQVVVGPRGAAAGKVELKRRMTGEREELSVEDALAKLRP